MPEVSTHEPGTPGWIDIGTDVEGAKAFYGPLFGWDAQEAGPPEETGGYGFFMKGGKMVAGYGPQQNPGPPFWSTYVIVADAQATAAKVTDAGGTVVVPPMDVMGQGHMAVFQDPEGAFFSIWQPGQHHGAQVVNEPGSLCWNEMNTRDADKARAFYPAVFGWEPEVHDDPMPYTEWNLGGRSIGGMLPMGPQIPADVPPHWLVYFAVDDADATLARVTELGGAVLMPPMEIPTGRFAVVADPQGAAFGVIRLSS